MIDRHYGHLARDGREHAIRLLDTFNAPELNRWTSVDAACTSEAPHGRRQSRRKHRLSRRKSEADAGTRTPDPLLTMEVLYLLSYVGAGCSLTGWSGGSRIRTCVGSAMRFTAAFL
jgi:hypothetical protein